MFVLSPFYWILQHYLFQNDGAVILYNCDVTLCHPDHIKLTWYWIIGPWYHLYTSYKYCRFVISRQRKFRTNGNVMWTDAFVQSLIWIHWENSCQDLQYFQYHLILEKVQNVHLHVMLYTCTIIAFWFPHLDVS